MSYSHVQAARASSMYGVERTYEWLPTAQERPDVPRFPTPTVGQVAYDCVEDSNDAGLMISRSEVEVHSPLDVNLKGLSDFIADGSNDLQRGVEAVNEVCPSDNTPRRHSTFYFQDGLVLLVGDVLFKLPRDPLIRECPFFREFLAAYNGSEQGLSDEKPIPLEDETLDFQRLVAYLYPVNLEYETFTQTWYFQEWRSILKLATKYNMQAVRLKAIRRINQLNSWSNVLEKIKCGKDFNYPPWVRQGFKDLVSREIPVITQVEGEYLGLKDSLRCSAARQMYRPRAVGDHRGHYGNTYKSFDNSIFGGTENTQYNETDVDSILDAVFGKDLSKRGEGEIKA